MPVRVTVVVPVYNGGRFLRPTLAAIQAQSVSALEIIVVDDGSTDETPDILREIASGDSRVMVVTQANAGVAAARNAGATRATAEFIAFCDADDWWAPAFLERCLDRFAHEPGDVGLVYAWTSHHDSDGVPVGSESASRHEGDVRRAIVLENFLASGSASVIRSSVFESIGGFETRFFREKAQGCEDWEFYVRVAEQTRFAVVREVLVCYRRTDFGMSAQHETMARSHQLMIDLLLARRSDVSGEDLSFTTSNFYVHLANEADRRRFAREALRWYRRALRCDFRRIIRRRKLYQLAIRNLWRVLTGTGRRAAERKS